MKITLAAGTPPRLLVDGRLAGEGVADCVRACRDAGPDVVLDLSGLRSADGSGIATLVELRAAGAKLEGASPYIRLLLEGMSGPVPDESARR